MIVWHFFRIFIHLMAGMLTCACQFPFSSPERRERLIRRWSQQLLAICTVDVAFQDASEGVVAKTALIVSNHVSWLDIFVINTLHPCHFVAKADIRSWPLVGWLCEQAGTIFLARGKQREVRRIYEGLVHQIQAGKRIAFFPEGTTAAQGTVLPFHANLFEAAIEAKVPVQPFVIRYIDASGQFHTAADFIGEMTFVDSLRVILTAPRMTAELIRLPAISTEGAHRRDVAQQARSAVMQALGVSAET
ncbi:lysophospholipid acyltransferase family protein [Undibacterium griseum]|uniref:1-acyl-sn-glycerol-3-phosphate acyltransferase n=1 Tax=Undibacterium griseum TaxID=2762295 RepID=A0ABR6YND6_9BURK|nr:1-acyl-sn-glycerol-3-phosphate acyltransferase [Undibacterium griseum]MBC3885416.1 1-acyl-sn-glycerol-3-phosphate acyltransferase [Undibacterium griseum]